MPLMRKSILYPVPALGLGALAAALRMWQRFSGYDASGLPVPMSPPAVLLTVFLLLCAALFLRLAVRLPKTLEDQSSAAPSGRTAFILTAVSGALLLVGGALNLKDFADGYLEVSSALYGSAEAHDQALRAFLLRNLLPLVMALASVPAAVALFCRCKRLRGGQAGERSAFIALMPSFFCWLWLIEVYRQHTANPILWDYVLLLFAAVALLVSGYFRAGFAFGVGKPRRAVYFSLLALFFALAALPDSGSPANLLTLPALLLHALTELRALLECFSYRPRRLAPEEPPFPFPTQQQEDSFHE